jgi:hypothetical protein
MTTVVQEKKAAIVRKEAVTFQKKTGNAPSRTCTAEGDPHFTNFNGEYFHIQQPCIFVFAKTSDGFFEVQVKQDGSTGPGSPSYVRAVAIRYDGKIYHNSFSKNGFVVRSGPSYVSVTVPGTYENDMVGICGANGPKASANNFKSPNGKLFDVNYGKRNWQLGGYGGSFTKMSRWHLSWRPSVDNCMFSKKECTDNIKDKNTARIRFVRTPWGRIDTNAL